MVKRQQGKKVEPTINRIQPFELGARLPLWFDVKGADAIASSYGTLLDNSLELAHDPSHKLPDIYGVVEKSNLRKGVNRIVIKSLRSKRVRLFMLNKNNEHCVEFIKSNYLKLP